MKKTTGLHDHTVTYPVGAPFMTPGTEAVRQTPSCHDGTHAAQQRTLAGDMNVAPTLPAVPTHTDEKTADHHDRTAAYPVGAPFMTPGTGAVRQTPSCHDGAHAAQWRTHAGDMNVAPTLPAVPTHTDEKTADHHDRTAAYPVGAPFMTPGTGSGKTNTDETRRRTRSATTHPRGRHECRPYAAGGSHMHG